MLGVPTARASAARRCGSRRCRRAAPSPRTTGRSRSTSSSAAPTTCPRSSGELIGGPVSYKLTGTSDPVVIRLAEGATVNVTVVDDAARPIEGADVKHDDEHAAKTNAAGKATLKPRASRAGSRSRPRRPAMRRARALHHDRIRGRDRRAQDHPAQGLRGVGPRDRRGRQADRQGRRSARAPARGGSAAPATTPRSPTTRASSRSPRSPPARHTLSAVDGEHAPARSSPITDRRRAPSPAIEITMKSGGCVAGTVIDTDGKPVPFATVRIGGKMSDGGQGWNVAARQATSDKDGTFELRGLARHEAAGARRVRHRREQGRRRRPVRQGRRERRSGSSSTWPVRSPGSSSMTRACPCPRSRSTRSPTSSAAPRLEGLQLAGMSSATTDGGGAFVIRGLPDGRVQAVGGALEHRRPGLGPARHLGEGRRQGRQDHARGAGHADRQDRARGRRGPADARDRPARLDDADPGKRWRVPAQGRHARHLRRHVPQPGVCRA